MKILLYINTSQNLDNSNYLGGIEILNYELAKFLKKKHDTILSSTLSKKLLRISWDIVISSNDSKIFNQVKTKRKILWLHNKLQIEKAFRKKQLFSLLFNNIEAVFVSKYLDKNTSRLYNFSKRTVIPNFLPSIFEKNKFSKNKKNKKNLFVWSVQRKLGLDELINVWKKKIYSLNSNCELHIFGVNYKNNKLIKYNIFCHGKIPRQKLLNFYKKSIGMICLGYDETFCLNAIEAMKMGLPIVSLGKTALNEIIEDKKNGYLIDNIDNIDKPIFNLINLDTPRRDSLSKYCIKFASNYNSNIIFKDWEKLICSN
jgi:glycosyltransferase involved in cell wall biosynthesis